MGKVHPSQRVRAFVASGCQAWAGGAGTATYSRYVRIPSTQPTTHGGRAVKSSHPLTPDSLRRAERCCSAGRVWQGSGRSPAVGTVQERLRGLGARIITSPQDRHAGRFTASASASGRAICHASALTSPYRTAQYPEWSCKRLVTYEYLKQTESVDSPLEPPNSDPAIPQHRSLVSSRFFVLPSMKRRFYELDYQWPPFGSNAGAS